MGTAALATVQTKNLESEYRYIFEGIVAEWERWPGPEAKFKVVPVVDKHHGRYVLLTVGWDGYKRIHGLLVHVEIRGGKFWIEADNTEDGIATDLLDAGVPEEHIVLAFQHPERRKWGEFAPE